MPNPVNTIAFNAGSPSVKGPNSGTINGVKFTGPTKSGKFWIAATSPKSKAGATREPNGKEKTDLITAFKTAMSLHTAPTPEDAGDNIKFVDMVEKANEHVAATKPVADTADTTGEPIQAVPASA